MVSFKFQVGIKISSQILFLLPLLILINVPKAVSFHWSGNTLYDLENADLTSEAASWDLSLYRTTGYKITYCSTEYILGGYCVLGGSGASGSSPYYGQYFYKTYNSLPTHNQVNIKMKVYAIDSWDGTSTDDHFEIGIDGNSIYAFRLNGFDPVYSNTNLCGLTYKDFPPFTVYLSYPHSSTTGLTLKIISCADEDSCNESIGFRDISIEFVTNSAPSSSLCAIGTAPLSSSPCPCAQTNMYMYPPNSGICYSCDSTCATCTDSTASACTSCPAGRYLSNKSCPACSGNCATCSGNSTNCVTCNPGWFMVGQTCYSSCPSPLKTNTVGGVTFCSTPCPRQYVYWDAVCSSTCSYPSNAAGNFPIYGSFVSTFLLCNYGCPSTSQVLYWNGTCSGSCPSPLSSSVFHGSTFCDFQCGTTQYLYWNGSCLNNCPSPLSSEAQGTYLPRQFCWYLCQPNQYMYWNGSCLSSCPWPLTSETQGTNLPRQFCWCTCQSTHYLYWNGSCLNTCPWPLSPETQGTNPTEKRNFCWYSCQPSQYMYWNGSCLNDCPAPLAKETQGTYLPRQFCWYLCQPNQYLYWNLACNDSCPVPLTPESQGSIALYKRNFCWYSCSPSDYLYWNGTCFGQCDPPLLKKTSNDRNFCTYSCPGGKYLLPDGSCVDSCPSGYFENEDLHDCQPCQHSLCAVCAAPSGAQCQLCKGSNILDSNGVCKDCQALKSQYIQQVDDTFTYQYKLRLTPASCDLDELTVQNYLSPTQDSKNRFPQFSFQVHQDQDASGKYFLLEIQFESAVPSDAGMSFALGSLQTDFQVPRTPGPSQSTADQGVKATFAAVTGSTVGAGLTLGATAALWSIISFQQFIGYFVYLNIQLPPHLIYFLTMFNNVSLEILPNPLASLTERFAELWDSLVNNTDKKYQLPHKFAEFDTPTLFVINAGSTFLVCVIILLLPYLFDLLRKFKLLRSIRFIKNLHSSLRWNIPIRVFLESGIPLTFALLIQMRKVSYSNIPYGISTVTAILAFIYLGLMINYISQTLRNFKYEDLQNPSVENSIGTLFEGIILKKEKPFGKYYYLLILFRGMLLVFMDVLAYQFPIIQTTVMAAFNVFFVYFVWFIIKFESRYLNWTNRIKEVLILVAEILFITLCYLQTEKYRDIVGWLVISMLGLTLAMELLFGFYLQILAVRDFVKRIREYCRERKRTKAVLPMPTEETSRNVLTAEKDGKTDLTFIS